jgi:hypothetical protein
MKQWPLFQDKARPPIAQLVMSASADNSAAPAKHTPYKPNLVSCNFWAFLVLECAREGQKLRSKRGITQATGYNPTQDVRKWPIAHVCEVGGTIKCVKLVNGIALKRTLC